MLKERVRTRLFTNAAARSIDAHIIDRFAVPGIELMRRAARSAFGVLHHRWPSARTVAVVCGPGNNGGDGYLLAHACRAAGMHVSVVAVDREPAGDAAGARDIYRRGGGLVHEATGAEVLLASADVVVDALFGSGLSRSLQGAPATMVALMNGCGHPVLALDVPSGIDGDTGRVMGCAVQASATTTFIVWKRGLFTADAVDHVGDLSLHELDLPAGAVPATMADVELLYQCALPARRRNSHKGRFGRVAVCGGDDGMGGAVILASRAALRVGTGLIDVLTRPAHVAPALAAQPELMVRGVADACMIDAACARASTLVVGPGLGQAAWGAMLWESALALDSPLLLDADGLNLLARKPRKFTGRDVVLTPHPGEAARLLGCNTAAVQEDRFAAARRLAEKYDAHVVLKGAGSLVAAPDGRLGLCRFGNPGMAAGGMGDVLSGVIGALLAQGLTPWQAAAVGTVLHAKAGDRAARAGERGLAASDLLVPLRCLVNGVDDERISM